MTGRVLLVAITWVSSSAAQPRPSGSRVDPQLAAHARSLVDQAWDYCHARFYPTITRSLSYRSAEIRVVEDGGHRLELSLVPPLRRTVDVRPIRFENLAVHDRFRRCVEGAFARRGTRLPHASARVQAALGIAASWPLGRPPWFRPARLHDQWGGLNLLLANRAIQHHLLQARWSCSASGSYRVELEVGNGGRVRQLWVTRGARTDAATRCIAGELRNRLRFPSHGRSSRFDITLH